MTKAAERAGVLTQELLRSLVDYDPESGRFTRKTIAHPGRRGYAYTPGEEAGSVNSQGYRWISIKYVRYESHRLAWFWVHCVWPENDIDHINGDRLDNRIANLRDVTRGINAQNKRAAMPFSSTGLLGVHRDSNGRTFSSRIKADGKTHYLGAFTTPEAAHLAYLQAKRQLHAGCTI